MCLSQVIWPPAASYFPFDFSSFFCICPRVSRCPVSSRLFRPQSLDPVPSLPEQCLNPRFVCARKTRTLTSPPLFLVFCFLRCDSEGVGSMMDGMKITPPSLIAIQEQQALVCSENGHDVGVGSRDGLPPPPQVQEASSFVVTSNGVLIRRIASCSFPGGRICWEWK